MKHLLYSSVVASCIFLFGCATNYNLVNTAPSGVNLITITTTDKAQDAYKTLGKILLKDNYELTQNDPSFLMLITKPISKSYGMGGGGNMFVKFIAEIEQKESVSVITLKGLVFDQETHSAVSRSMGLKNVDFNIEKDGTVIQNKGMSGSSLNESWQLMQSIAEKYPNGKISF